MTAGEEARDDLTITWREFDQFRTIFYGWTGIRFEDHKRYFVEARLKCRVRETGHGSFRSYFQMLRDDSADAEWQTLANRLTTSETYFFREEYHFRALVRDVLPDVVRRKRAGDPIRVWSIPCATGEEPYSIALYLMEHWPGARTWSIDILASDINTTVLDKARAGVFGRRSVAPVPAHLLKKYFQPQAPEVWQVRDRLRQTVQFSQINIVKACDTGMLSGADIIFCRNMLIYFDDRSRKAALDVLFGALAPGGFLFVGYTEARARLTDAFKARRLPDALVFQKPAVPARA
ncbi:CheR family methyltransferase [Roseospira marina]|uniref:CheR family methyltransferase n=1 Tax=Roseospira marina TaxID=140057 RepID=UPI001478A645|nr:protein-glutamate O-methyltransferase CheR [Roseospira marina]MBB4312453.1 chemotaxis protein methyltransferase CheR [Roseospira marina]MBB5085531.1 chemotaxis protein methyltransferase CheR [Roseospira marina]